MQNQKYHETLYKIIYIIIFLFITAGLLSGQTGCDDLLINLGDDIAEAGATLRPYFEDVANVGGKRIKAWKLLGEQIWMRQLV